MEGAAPSWKCRACGREASGGALFCGECGAGRPAGAGAPEAIEWELGLPLLTNRFILYDFGKVFAWTALIMIVLLGGILAATGDLSLEQMGMMAAATALGIFVVALLAIFVMAVFFGNRYRMGFRLDGQGVGYQSLSRRGKWANRAAVVAGALSGRPGVAGAGLVAASQEEMELEWSEIRAVNDHEAERVLSLRNTWRVVLRLHCKPENYEAVRAYVAARVAPGAIAKVGADGEGERVKRMLAGVAAYAAVSMGAGGLTLPWLAGASALLAASGWMSGTGRGLLSLGAAVLAGLQAGLWPGDWGALAAGGWRSAPVAIGFVPFILLLAEAGLRRAPAAVVLLVLALPGWGAEGAKPPWRGMNFFSEADEVALGRQYAKELDSQLALLNAPEVVGPVERIGRRLAAHAPRQAEWRFSVVNSREVNAFAVPGGFIYVNRGLVEMAQSEDELAGVLAHEIAHVVARHGTRAMSKQLLLTAIALGASLAVSRKSERWGEITAAAGGAAMLMAQLKYSRNDEYQADRVGAEIMQRAGYSPQGLAAFFRRLQGERAAARAPRGERWLALINTHPPTAERIARLQPLLEGAPAPGAAGVELAQLQKVLQPLAYPEERQDRGVNSVVAALAGEGGGTTPVTEGLDWRTAPRVKVPGDTVWMNTGLSVRRQDAIAIQAEGEIWPVRGQEESCGPGGMAGANKGFFKPISGANTGALVARIKTLKGHTTTPVLIGEGASFTATHDGMLELGINDDNNFDNKGEFQAEVLIRRRQRP